MLNDCTEVCGLQTNPLTLQVGLHLPRREDLMWASKGQGLTENARPEK